MKQVVQIRLREAGKIFQFDTKGFPLNAGDYCIVEMDRGLEFGEVVSEPEMVVNDVEVEQIRKVVRIATDEDVRKRKENRLREGEAFEVCFRKIEERELPMKLVDAEQSFDGSKLIFYFTAEGRIDFRELVKDLAHVFKTRIEMRQIGVRDEARLLGGIGCCGRRLCCVSFLKSFEPVTIRMARDQRLPLNPAKISGLCGRLMCCLAYEHNTYRELGKKLPREGTHFPLEEGMGKVVEVYPLKGTVVLELEDKRRLEVHVDKLPPKAIVNQ